MLEQLRKRVLSANQALIKNNLVRWTSGNASARDPKTGYVIIKPSGILFEELTEENLVIIDLEGTVIEGELAPSVDTASHLYVYKNRFEINGIVHTHSPYATSFAVLGRSLPIYTTTAAAVFGQEIPISDFAIIGEEEIGREIVTKIGTSSAILLRSHGVFTVGENIEKALKNAVLLEESAEVAHLALVRGEITPLSEDVVSQGYNIYHTTYGQK